MNSYVDPKVASAVLDSNKRFLTTRTTGVDVYYIGAADTAKLIRSALKLAFPGVKFSVTSKNYSGGSSVDVRWTDGPNGNMVDTVLAGFVGKGFDGMIDMAYSSDCYITRAGGVGFAHSAGTVGSRGSVSGADAVVPFGAAIVTFMSYIHTSRDRSDYADRPDPYTDHWAYVDWNAKDFPLVG